MNPDIEAIFLDVGNTLRIVLPEPDFQAQARQQLMQLIGSKEDQVAFFEKVEERWKAYRKYSKNSLLEASELELWTQWLLPDYPIEIIAPHTSRLTRLWRDRDGRIEFAARNEDGFLIIHGENREGFRFGHPTPRATTHGHSSRARGK